MPHALVGVRQFRRFEYPGESYAEEGSPKLAVDTGALEQIIDQVIAANPKQLEQYRGGKKTVAAFFVGQVMKATKGQYDPATVNQLVAKKLDGA